MLLCNLGTPDAPTPSAVQRYLAEFLSDDRVVEIPKPVWKLILRGHSAQAPQKSAPSTRHGVGCGAGLAHLLHWTRRQAEILQEWMQGAGYDVLVGYAMRYGKPSIAKQLDALKAQGATRILILPLYPQYSGTTTAACAVRRDWAKTQRHIPELRADRSRYHNDPGYIRGPGPACGAALASPRYGPPPGDELSRRTRAHPRPGRPLPGRMPGNRPPAGRMPGPATERFTVTFQSRFGKAKWLEPYTEPSLIALAQAGIHGVDMICPGFTSDCIETLEEINMEVRAAYLGAGGKQFHFIPCLNDTPHWIDALRTLTLRHTAGWPVQPIPRPSRRQQPSPRTRPAQRCRQRPGHFGSRTARHRILMCTGQPCPSHLAPQPRSPCPAGQGLRCATAASPRLPAPHTLPQECPATECPGAQGPACLIPIRVPVPMARAAWHCRTCQNHVRTHLAPPRLHARESAKVGLHRTGAVPVKLSHYTAAHGCSVTTPHPRPALTLPARFGKAAFCEGCTHAARSTFPFPPVSCACHGFALREPSCHG